MNITSVTTGDGSPRTPLGRWPVTSPVQAPPLRSFRQVLRLRFETGGMADRIEVDPRTTTLRAAFRAHRYNALAPGEPSLQASLAGSGGTVEVTLDAPRQVERVRLSSGAVSGPGHTVEFYRLDGDTLASKPTVTVGVEIASLTDAGLTGGVTGGVTGRPVGAASPATPGTLDRRITTIALPGATATLPTSVDFTDRRFAVRLAGPTNRPLRAADLAELGLRSFPTGPRIGIADPARPDSATFFWRAPGEVGKGVPSESGTVDAGAALAQALGRYLDDFFAGLESNAGTADQPARPQTVDADVVVESDAPCVLDITHFDVTYRLVRRSLPSGKEKLVLRFSGGRTTVREVPILLPGNAVVRSATIETVESFGAEGSFASGGGLSSAALAQDRGVRLSTARWAAQALTPTRAVTASGVALALMATAGNTEVLVQLREDFSGGPTGRELASGAVTLGRVGGREWVTLSFAETVILSSGPYWILAKAASGGAVWLAETGGVPVRVPVRVLEGADNAQGAVGLGPLDTLQAACRILVRSDRVYEEHRVVLAVGEGTVEPTGDQSGRRAYDLTAAIGRCLHGLSPASSEANVTLTLTSASRGFVTVDAPLVEYDLA